MSVTSLETAVTLNPNVLFRELESESMLLNLETGKYYGLDSVGTRFWQLLVQSGSPRGTVDTLVGEYAVDAETLEGDLLRLLNDLRLHGLILLASGTTTL